MSSQGMDLVSCARRLVEEAEKYLWNGPIGKFGVGNSCRDWVRGDCSRSSKEFQMSPAEDLVSFTMAATKLYKSSSLCVVIVGRSFTLSGGSSSTGSSSWESKKIYI